MTISTYNAAEKIREEIKILQEKLFFLNNNGDDSRKFDLLIRQEGSAQHVRVEVPYSDCELLFTKLREKLQRRIDALEAQFADL